MIAAQGKFQKAGIIISSSFAHDEETRGMGEGIAPKPDSRSTLSGFLSQEEEENRMPRIMGQGLGAKTTHQVPEAHGTFEANWQDGWTDPNRLGNRTELDGIGILSNPALLLT